VIVSTSDGLVELFVNVASKVPLWTGCDGDVLMKRAVSGVPSMTVQPVKSPVSNPQLATRLPGTLSQKVGVAHAVAGIIANRTLRDNPPQSALDFIDVPPNLSLERCSIWLTLTVGDFEEYHGSGIFKKY
jgi:hypothetical protein